MSLYLKINLIIISVPLVLSLYPKFTFSFRKYLKAVTIVSSIFIVWDMYATHAKHWGFNEKHIGHLKLINLPFEEVLFFITVPFAMLFLAANLEKNIPKKNFSFPTKLLTAAGIIIILLSFYFSALSYSFLVSWATGLTVILISKFGKTFFTNYYCFYIIFGMILFFIFNHFLTDIPIVLYGKNYFSGVRISTIPLEDFFYNFSLLSFYFLVFKKA